MHALSSAARSFATFGDCRTDVTAPFSVPGALLIAEKAGLTSCANAEKAPVVVEHLSARAKFLKYFHPHVSILLVVIAYLFAGAAAFLQLEQPAEKLHRNQGLKEFKSYMGHVESQIYIIFNSSCETETENITKAKLHNELRSILGKWDEFSRKFDVKASDDWTAEEIKGRWTFSEAVLFTFSLITTIGYGHMTPTTLIGRTVVIFYGLLGIPLTMISIANTGKFFAEALTLFNLLVKTYSQQLWNWCFRRYFQERRQSTKVKGKKSKDNGKIGELNHNNNEAELQEEPEGEVLISVRQLMFVFFTYVMLGACFLPQYEDMDFFTACYFCFISITTVGFGDVYPRQHGYLAPTLLYLTAGLALTTMAIELSAQYLMKIHYFGRSIQNAKSALIRFGNKLMTVGDLMQAIERLYTSDPVGGIENIKTMMENNLDTFVKQEIVKTQKIKEEKKKQRKQKEKMQKDKARKLVMQRLIKWFPCCAPCLGWIFDPESRKKKKIEGCILEVGLSFGEALQFIDDEDCAASLSSL